MACRKLDNMVFLDDFNIMNSLELTLPVILLLLAFMLKLAIGRAVTGPNIIHAICELPVDATFLSISFLISFIILDEKNVKQGLFCFLGYLVGAIVIVMLWRKSVYVFDGIGTKIKKCRFWVLFSFLLLLNLGLATFCVMYSIDLLLSTATEVVENK